MTGLREKPQCLIIYLIVNPRAKVSFDKKLRAD